MKPRALSIALAAVLVAGPIPARAWETSTHIGLAEQAAIAAELDQQLRALGVSGGLFEPLTVPPADATELMAALARHSPSDGFTPDARGRQVALSWLLAGAALADANPAWVANHFYDPQTGTGWRAPATGVFARIFARIGGVVTPPSRGTPAPDWIVSANNPLALPGFLDQYEKALRTATPGERSRHWAGTLIAAGAILHVLGDLASPERVRGDAAAHNELIGADARDRGSRFERLAAIAWGRLGVPAATQRISLPTWREFFVGTNADQPGLAQWISARYFSAGTLPRPIDVGSTRRDDLADVLARSLARPTPTVPRRLNLMAAGQASGATLRDGAGVCLARYRVANSRLSWWLDDDCLLEQAAAILPVAAAYQAGLLRWLFRGDLRLTQAGGRQLSITVHGTPLGKGALELLAEDTRGIRTQFHRGEVEAGADGAVIATVSPPIGARRVIASFRGIDHRGEPVVAAGLLDVEP